VIKIAIITALIGVSPTLADSIYCSTWQGITTCSGPAGYTSTEMQWQGMTLGQDSGGNPWTSSRWQGFDITTVTPPPGR
jgi:hypothetical protein